MQYICDEFAHDNRHLRTDAEYQKVVKSEELGISQFELMTSFQLPFGLLFSPARTVPSKNGANCGMTCALRQLFLLDCLTDCSKEQIGADKRRYPSRLGLSPTRVKRSSILSTGFGVLARSIFPEG